MKLNLRYLVLATIILAIMLIGVGEAAFADWSGNWSVLAGGGNISSSGILSLSGTIGQSVTGASTSAGGDYWVGNGFWGGVELYTHHLFLPLVLKLE
jgi:hypothetical protein